MIRKIIKLIQLLLIVYVFGWCLPIPAWAVVGDEEINYATITDMRRDHEELMTEEFEGSDEEQRAYLIRLVEEKRKKAAEGSEEEKTLSQELIRLKSESLIRTKKWRDRIRFSPFEKISFDSNIQNQKQAKSDVIFNSGLGMQIDLGTQRTDIDIDYLGSYAAYIKKPELNRFENQLAVNGRYPFSSKTNATASYRLSTTGDQNSEIRSVLERLRQDAALTFNQRLSRKTAIRIGQTFSDVFFLSKKDQGNDSSQYTLSPEFNYLISHKTSIFARYAFGISKGGLNDSNDATAHELRGGIRGKIAPKTTALLDFGVSRQNLDTLGGHVNGFVAEVVVITNITRKSRLELLINRSFSKTNETTGSNFFVTENYRLTGTTQFRRHIAGEVLIGLRRNLFEQNNSISDTNQRDLTLELGSTLRYDFRKWLSLELQYLFTGVNASDSRREYGKHLVSLALNGKY
ncbi:MAG: hypothetical protein COV74_09470 [Candidatus Omnitrophica bacterium CG11_big_fil_rev_8_21_14_0_20_45_26]|uniref:Uncharacterized protein n=1 Tax=Candidatus Abzuiibacterium crystallinum TaxID=1974748 RepID=A0A2H0LLA9_9BACT|nr:MAG: hypothetical protein COV74_09470 [Candidatus Omnitrophica bacterium CG11_big_fil_rev_8_21_14_0_20_45_26]PIW65374.1 MAG: hypothetical protein COW12_02040 [Candidatus Omnitrophica bacterium CG12_big_fil_rev_8_21_14_0_65_45_16]